MRGLVILKCNVEYDMRIRKFDFVVGSSTWTMI